MFNWVDYVNLASELSVRSEEACQRAAISRAYYGTFCIARNRLRSEGFRPTRGGTNSHDVYWQQYSRSASANRQEIADLGRKLKRARRQADYDDKVDSLDRLIIKSMTRANRLLSVLQSL